jgi:hypothetical protein
MKDFKDFPGSMPAGGHGAGEVFRAWRPAEDFGMEPAAWEVFKVFKVFRWPPCPARESL